jgi:hypothetical protein
MRKESEEKKIRKEAHDDAFMLSQLAYPAKFYARDGQVIIRNPKELIQFLNELQERC